MLILGYKLRMQSPSNLLLRADIYDTISNHTILSQQKIKTDEKKMKMRRILCITKTPGGDYGYRKNPDSSSFIYMTPAIEDQ